MKMPNQTKNIILSLIKGLSKSKGFKIEGLIDEVDYKKINQFCKEIEKLDRLDLKIEISNNDIKEELLFKFQMK